MGSLCQVKRGRESEELTLGLTGGVGGPWGVQGIPREYCAEMFCDEPAASGLWGCGLCGGTTAWDWYPGGIQEHQELAEAVSVTEQIKSLDPREAVCNLMCK